MHFPLGMCWQGRHQCQHPPRFCHGFLPPCCQLRSFCQFWAPLPLPWPLRALSGLSSFQSSRWRLRSRPFGARELLVVVRLEPLRKLTDFVPFLLHVRGLLLVAAAAVAAPLPLPLPPFLFSVGKTVPKCW